MKWKRIAAATLVACAVTGIAYVSQPHFRADTAPDLISELMLLPGKLAATPFADRGTASAEFTWRSLAANVAILTAIAYFILPRKLFSN